MSKTVTKASPIANINPFGLRMQPDLKERVQDAATKNNRSLNAEIVETLEDKYPPLQIDLNTLTSFFQYISHEVEQSEDAESFIKELNDTFSKADIPYTVRDDLGALTFYPYASPAQKSTPSESK